MIGIRFLKAKKREVQTEKGCSLWHFVGIREMDANSRFSAYLDKGRILGSQEKQKQERSP